MHAPPFHWRPSFRYAFTALLLVGVLGVTGCGRKRAPQLIPDSSFVQEGIASYYDNEFVGRPTASGEIFAAERMTAAHPSLPFGTQLKVTNLENGRQALVTVNDRGPFVKNRILDLSRAGAQALGYLQAGTARVRLEIVALPPPAGPFWLQLGAFREPEAAQALLDRLRAAGEQPTVVEEDQYRKIRLGPFPSRDAARKQQERWRRRGVPGYLVEAAS